jgi:hypothetical protein
MDLSGKTADDLSMAECYEIMNMAQRVARRLSNEARASGTDPRLSPSNAFSYGRLAQAAEEADMACFDVINVANHEAREHVAADAYALYKRDRDSLAPRPATPHTTRDGDHEEEAINQ